MHASTAGLRSRWERKWSWMVRPSCAFGRRHRPPVASIEIIRSGEIVYSAKPGKRNVELSYRDADAPANGSEHYHVRLVQSDGQIALVLPCLDRLSGSGLTIRRIALPRTREQAGRSLRNRGPLDSRHLQCDRPAGSGSQGKRGSAAGGGCQYSCARLAQTVAVCRLGRRGPADFARVGYRSWLKPPVASPLVIGAPDS